MPYLRRLPAGRLVVFAVTVLLAAPLGARETDQDPFRQLEDILPSPNAYRTASGAPGASYWQQRADYRIEAELDDEDQTLTGRETIRYTNHSPDTLPYVWLQLDRNLFRPDSASALTRTAPSFEKFPYKTLAQLLARQAFDGRMNIESVLSASGQPIEHTIVETMMRLDLPEPLQPGESVEFSIAWNTRIHDGTLLDKRSGYEYFEDDGNYIYEVAHWFPRMAAYTDVNGWQHKQFLGSGEFTLEFGDYDVALTVPADHIVAATGELANPEEVLEEKQRERLREARTAESPVFVVTPDEARARQAEQSRDRKTWRFRAENVRDFAFASSRKFIWDAQGHPAGDRSVMAMSFYPLEAEPLWSHYSTHAIVHTLDVYSRHTFPYPYPVAISVNGPAGGMEYPMLAFNGPRPEPDGTYSKRTKYGLISVVIHEVGHNYFPMIVNSDERQWTWMDEGLNSFLQFIAEKEWEENYPSRRGEPRRIVDYMTSARQMPVMTNSESLLQFGNNAYAKPATALNILRESILGRELFDFAFRQYAQRWRFKRPEPADFFRTLEDASAVDLDWFWNGWFYTTKHTDLALTGLRRYTMDTGDPEVDKERRRETRREGPPSLTDARNREIKKRVDEYPDLKDFYNQYDELEVTPQDREDFRKLLADLDDGDERLLRTERNFYVLEIENVGGLVMPVLLEITYADDSREEMRIPAEIWRRDSEHIEKLLVTSKEIRRVELDPHQETADTDRRNNVFPSEPERRSFELHRDENETPNPMQEAKETS